VAKVAKISLFNRRGNEPIVVSLVVIDVEFGRKNHCSIHITAIGMMLKSLDVTTDSRKQIKPTVKAKKIEGQMDGSVGQFWTVF
jgi:hypothetical protein